MAVGHRPALAAAALHLTCSTAPRGGSDRDVEEGVGGVGRRIEGFGPRPREEEPPPQIAEHEQKRKAKASRERYSVCICRSVGMCAFEE